jgi:phage RecT family recombinase
VTTQNNSRALTFDKPGDLQRFLETGKGAIAAALPKHLNPDRMLRLAVTSFSTTPALRQCTGHSILASIVVASQLGLEPGVAGQGYLIPYKNTCTFVPGWQGLVGLLNNTGRATAWTGAVFEGDTWEFELGSSPKCKHVPGDNYGDPEKMIWVYACGKVNGSEQTVIEAWPISRVWRHRDKNNKVGRAHYSYNHPEMYARKVVLLQVLKYMPRSIELNNALVAADSAVDGVIEPQEGDIDVQTSAPVMDPPTPRQTRAPRTGGGGALFGSGGGGGSGEQPAPTKKPEDQTTPSQALRNLCNASRVTEAQVLAFINKDRALKADSFEDVGAAALRDLADNWADILPQISDAPPLG